jgi:hypothetical protein
MRFWMRQEAIHLYVSTSLRGARANGSLRGYGSGQGNPHRIFQATRIGFPIRRE